MRQALLLLTGLLAALPAAAEVYTWIDDQGVTHVVDDPAAVPEGQRAVLREGRDALQGLWGGEPRGPEAGTPGQRSADLTLQDDRVRRLLRGAVDDLERGETARASAVLESVLRLDPNQPEAHWYLALLARQRGRYQAAEAHLEAFLAAAGDDHESWRQAARRKLDELADERQLASHAGAAAEWVGVEHPHFLVHYDAQLGRISPDYAEHVLRYLEEAYAEVGRLLGAVPREPLGVRFYGKAAYLRAHRHRFTFQTVGFFDGRIHVVSAAHPAGELRALLFHEYTHAVFREQTGGDRPFWLNEGLAELSERASRKQVGLSSSERSALRRRIDAGQWIPLRQLAPSFSGLGDEDARAAYLISTAAAAWIEARTERAQRRALLERFGAGAADDQAFAEVLGLTTDRIDAAVQAWIRDEFPVARPPL